VHILPTRCIYVKHICYNSDCFPKEHEPAAPPEQPNGCRLKFNRGGLQESCATKLIIGVCQCSVVSVTQNVVSFLKTVHPTKYLHVAQSVSARVVFNEIQSLFHLATIVRHFPPRMWAIG
jgi:hypothetical protein